MTAGVPILYGKCFQAVSVDQGVNGQTDAKGAPSPKLADALRHTDASLGKFPATLQAGGNDKDTLVIVESKILAAMIEGESPGLAAQMIKDDVVPIWLTVKALFGDATKGNRTRSGPAARSQGDRHQT